MFTSRPARLLVLMLAMLLPIAQYVSFACGGLEASEHADTAPGMRLHAGAHGRGGAHDHGAARDLAARESDAADASAGRSGRDDSRPSRDPATCPMSAPCAISALQAVQVTVLPQGFGGELDAFDVLSSPASIDRSATTPPPRFSA